MFNHKAKQFEEMRRRQSEMPEEINLRLCGLRLKASRGRAIKAFRKAAEERYGIVGLTREEQKAKLARFRGYAYRGVVK